jgi:hypothetical protein
MAAYVPTKNYCHPVELWGAATPLVQTFRLSKTGASVTNTIGLNREEFASLAFIDSLS